MMSNKQYIFCLETNSKAKTDWLYIRKIVDILIQDNITNDKFIPLYMKGKNNYNSKSFVKDVNTKISNFDGTSTVIYCIDLDDYEINYKTKEFVGNVEDYCKLNKYEFVYFSRNIEEVIWNRKISQEDKVKMAIRFSRTKTIDKNAMNRLSSAAREKTKSNLLIILKKYIDSNLNI